MTLREAWEMWGTWAVPAATVTVSFLLGRLWPKKERCTTMVEYSGPFDTTARCKAPPDKRCAAGQCTKHCRQHCDSACIKRWTKMMEPT